MTNLIINRQLLMHGDSLPPLLLEARFLLCPYPAQAPPPPLPHQWMEPLWSFPNIPRVFLQVRDHILKAPPLPNDNADLAQGPPLLSWAYHIDLADLGSVHNSTVGGGKDPIRSIQVSDHTLNSACLLEPLTPRVKNKM